LLAIGQRSELPVEVGCICLLHIERCWKPRRKRLCSRRGMLTLSPCLVLLIWHERENATISLLTAAVTDNVDVGCAHLASCRRPPGTRNCHESQLSMIDGDNRGERSLAHQRVQAVSIAHCSPDGCTRLWLVTRPCAFTSAAKSTQDAHNPWRGGNVTFRYGSALL
jgi:hypothetical protein